MATPDEISVIWRMLRASYDYFGRDRTPEQMAETLGIYQQLLADIPLDALRAAAMQTVSASRFFPTVAELRQAAAPIMVPPGPTAMQAWGRVLRAFQTGEYYEYYDRTVYPDWSDDPILQETVRDMGGMRHLGMSENQISDRAQFIKAYEARQARVEQEQKMLPEVREVRDRLQAERAAKELGDGQPKPIGLLVGAVVGRKEQGGNG